MPKARLPLRVFSGKRSFSIQSEEAQKALIETAKADACRDHWLASIGGPPDEHPHRESKEVFGGLFRRIAGKTQRLGELARASGRAWLHGHCGARKLYLKAT